MKPNKFRIGITGSIATGKSAASAYIRSRGHVVIDADAIARDIVAFGQPGLLAIKEQFGSRFILPDGNLNRDAMAKYIFAHPAQRQRLNELLHPLIYQAMITLDDIQDVPMVFFDIPLLFENDLDKNNILLLNEIWLIATTAEIQLQRLMARDAIDETFAQMKINSQLPMYDKISRAHRVFDNSQSPQALHQLLEHAIKQIERTMS